MFLPWSLWASWRARIRINVDMPAKKLMLRINITYAKHILCPCPWQRFNRVSHDLFWVSFVYKVFNFGLLIWNTEFIGQFFLAAIFE
jgi:hypothetical protein